MKPQELRLSNYVIDAIYKFPMWIASMGFDTKRGAYLYLDFEGNEGDVWEDYTDEVLPVPIKDYEELLEKFGFEYNEAERKWKALKGSAIITLIQKGEKYALAIEEEGEENGYYFDVKFIHDLQNKVFDTINIALQ